MAPAETPGLSHGGMMLNFCGNAIDWSATGSMISGLGAWVGSGAVLYAAHKGTTVFRDWKRQKVTERHMDLAEQILVHAYRLQTGYKSLRSTLKQVSEIKVAQQELTSEGVISTPSTSEATRAIVDSRVYLNRFKLHREHYDALRTLLPRVAAYFGIEVEEPVLLAAELYFQYEWAAKGLAHDSAYVGYYAGGDLLPMLQRQGEVDAEQAKMDGYIESLNLRLLPILRDHG